MDIKKYLHVPIPINSGYSSPPHTDDRSFVLIVEFEFEKIFFLLLKMAVINVGEAENLFCVMAAFMKCKRIIDLNNILKSEIKNVYHKSLLFSTQYKISNDSEEHLFKKKFKKKKIINIPVQKFYSRHFTFKLFIPPRLPSTTFKFTFRIFVKKKNC